MKYLFILLMLMCSPSLAQVNVIPGDTSNNPQMNEELRRVNAQIGNLSIPSWPVSLSNSAWITGTLPIANGGTGQTTAQAAIDALLPSQGAANGKFLTSNGSASSWGTVNSSGYSNVLFQWHGNNIYNITYGLYIGTGLNAGAPNGNNYVYLTTSENFYNTVFSTKFLRTAGINTVTVYFNGETTSNQDAYWNCIIGSVSTATHWNVNNHSGAYWSSLTLDVSGLTNGSVYDVSWQMYSGNRTNASTYDIIAFGS